LQEIAGAGAVGGGRAYGVCRCAGAESEGVERCTFSQALGQARVVCGDGYALTVRARLRQGRPRVLAPSLLRMCGAGPAATSLACQVRLIIYVRYMMMVMVQCAVMYCTSCQVHAHHDNGGCAAEYMSCVGLLLFISARGGRSTFAVYCA